MRRLLGLRDLVHDAVEKTTDLVEEQQESVAEKTIRAISLAPGLGEAARAVDDARRLTAAAVYATIRATNQGIRDAGGAGIELARKKAAEAGLASPETALAESPALATLSRWADHAQGALNGVVGDFLRTRENGLEIEMGFRVGGRPLLLEPEALARELAEATGRICIFVHGLGCTEWVWNGMPLGRKTDFGSNLRAELGYTPIYVRYNTGLHVSENGRRLADLVGELSSAYPEPLREVVLVGHSMGGLVARSAAHYAAQASARWTEKLSHVFSIGSPHLGAPLEKAGNVLASILGFFDTPGTQVPAKIINGRSAGIKDLRFGYVLDDDWQGKDADAFLEDNRHDAPFVDGVRYGFVAATLTRDPEHPVGKLVGDLLVRVPSAAGHAPEPARRIRFHVGSVIEGANHLELLTHPEVYEQIRRCLAGPPE